jgi:lipopolysaccharide/colanic/teichoic acid biosynthesis glycosyltransferase
MKHTFYVRFGKRALDLFGAIFGLVVLAPLFVIIAVLVKATSRGPVFFRQVRVGQFGKPLRIFKFRSMTAGGSGRGASLTTASDPRVTRLGQWLRRSKVDELPQLINVVLGHMSLVGPRPEVPEYVATYTKAQKKVLLEKPGITGFVAMNNVQEEELLAAQADKHHYYQTVLLPVKLRLDLLYCRDVRLLEDLRILFGTFFKIFRRSAGASSSVIQIARSTSESEVP